MQRQRFFKNQFLIKQKADQKVQKPASGKYLTQHPPWRGSREKRKKAPDPSCILRMSVTIFFSQEAGCSFDLIQCSKLEVKTDSEAMYELNIVLRIWSISVRPFF